ncbi:predicted protein [Streptomyces viridochromogenes DSM 40736]|uniref:Predicted protein n=1 Tax=Streptomyces viridochromogenes (strain DSM 40736 / JCM 4977 / BCRC 1201 / Tue 494) TaxID=591159 RepID=D9XFQ9_STRVT|nr:predicted protein [Streptomyces viridochromogenes DSM 40736]
MRPAGSRITVQPEKPATNAAPSPSCRARVTGSILGAGLGRRLAEVRWGVAGRMAAAWLITLPAAALVGGPAASVVRGGGDLGTAVVALVGVALAAGLVAVSRRNPVDAHNVNDAYDVNDAHQVTIRTEQPAKVGAAA